MTTIKNLLLVLLFLTINIFAQLSAPMVESVYGGRINGITGFAKNSDTSRIFIATESANSLFYADIFSNSTTPVFKRFYVMPGVDASANYGANIRLIAAHSTSGNVYFSVENEILSTNPSTHLVSTAYSGTGFIGSLLIIDDYMYFTQAGFLHFGTLDAVGNFTENSDSPLTFTYAGNQIVLFKNPISEQLYIFTEGNSPFLYKTSDTYNSLTSTTTFSNISLTSLSTSVYWRGFGVGPDARLFTIGDDKYIAYSDDETTWTQFSTSIGGVANRTIAFSGDSSNYHVFASTIYSTFKGESATWDSFGNSGGMETHPNDGDVFVDPINSNIVYLTTDQGFGASVDKGETIFEINDGIEAVQVNDFSMLPNKTSAWVAAKSGLRKVINYLTTPSWTNAIFPNFDGSPYHSVEMSKDDTNRVFAGNVRIYKTNDNGNNWNQVFTPENAPYNFPGVGIMANTIEECSFSPNIVMAGFEIQNSSKGGLFVSEDYGITWNQILLEASVIGEDVDVADIVFNYEGTDTVAYVGAIYDLSLPQGRSIYRVVKYGTSWIATQDMDASGTAVGYPITATIQDLVVTSTSDTIYATGTDAGINHPITYYKVISGTNLWTTMPTTGYPFATGKQSTAITVGIDTIYVAVDHEIYFYPLGATQWQLGYSYPVGTDINFLYFDELLAGTSFGLYGHIGGNTTVVNYNSIIPTELVLEQNYPNPFNPETIINYSVPNQTNVEISVFNILGQKVQTLINSQHSTGNYNIKFSANNFASGVYIYQIKANNILISKKMMLVK